ncbi:MAG: phosphatidate cytidylyltransferase [Anaerolineae bacterium]|nr:phosphatidate cytidylyltransferase [Anaerolineae bacterium]
MLRSRLLTAIVLIPVVVGCIYWGKLAFLALVMLLLTLAEIEFCQLVTRQGFRPAPVFGVGLVWVFLLSAYLQAPWAQSAGLALVFLASLAWQLAHREGMPVADWALTVSGGIYLGVCGAHLIALRALPDGLWWTLTVIPSVMLADSAAYFIGSRWGRRKLAPVLSPGKTWEGYVGGIVVGALLTAFFASLWRLGAGAGSAVGATHGLILGTLIATVAPLGDLAVSMIKRSAGVKDSGNLLPGHGGALDRVDSILWAAVIGYYYVLLVA